MGCDCFWRTQRQAKEVAQLGPGRCSMDRKLDRLISGRVDLDPVGSARIKSDRARLVEIWKA